MRSWRNIRNMAYTYGSSPPTLGNVTFRVRTHKAAEELARQMCDQMCRKIYYSDPDRPQEGWFIVSTEPFEEKQCNQTKPLN